MCTIHEMSRRSKEAVVALPKIAAAVLVEHRTDIVQKQREQLFDGLNKDGKKIGRYKNPTGYYSRKKHAKNPVPGLGNVDAVNTGAYEEGLKLIVDTKTYTLMSTDSKAAKLAKDYPGILGLHEENKNEVKTEIMQPGLVRGLKAIYKV